MKELVIRKATENDFEQMFKLWLEMQSFHEKWDLKWYRPEEGCKTKVFDYWSQKLKDDNSIIVVADNGNDLIGMVVSFIITRPPVLENQFNILFIDNVIVNSNFRRFGVFKKMMKLLMTIAKEKNVSAINLTSNYENEIAIKAYENFGLHKKEINMLMYL